MRNAVLFVLAVCGWTGVASAQHEARECTSLVFDAPGAETRFIECARDGTSKYQDRTVAILDGYRMIGGDFPAMGEHWINLALLFDSTFDPQRPEILSYVVVSGEPRLLGVAYALPLLAGESAPVWPASGAWHDHYRTLDEETAVREDRLPSQTWDQARIAMLHAWIWFENPDGTFAPDNWAIPYLRLGLVPPDGAPTDAAQALSLLSGGSDHFLASIDKTEAPSRSERQRIELAFGRAEVAVERLIADHSFPILNAHDATHLSKIWVRLWNSIEEILSGRFR